MWSGRDRVRRWAGVFGQVLDKVDFRDHADDLPAIEDDRDMVSFKQME
jgi:hypothetical protein